MTKTEGKVTRKNGGGRGGGSEEGEERGKKE